MAGLFSCEKSTYAISLPWPTNRVWLPSRNPGSRFAFLVRSTTTWNDPLAAWYRLSAVIDLSRTGPLRTDVVSPNGLRSRGSRFTAASATISTAMATMTAAAAASFPTSP